MRTVERGRGRRASLAGPLARAILIGLAGAAGLAVVGGLLASTAGLLFVAGLAGAAIGLALSRAAAPSPTAPDPDGVPVIARRTVLRLAVLIAAAAVLAGALVTWLIAIAEGGALGPLDYLWTTFGLFVPAELIVASIAAAWGANAGPVTGR